MRLLQYGVQAFLTEVIKLGAQSGFLQIRQVSKV
jgi:hypothetical protein